MSWCEKNLLRYFTIFNHTQNFIEHFSVMVASFMTVFHTNFTIALMATVVINALLVTMALWLPWSPPLPLFLWLLPLSESARRFLLGGHFLNTFLDIS